MSAPPVFAGVRPTARIGFDIQYDARYEEEREHTIDRPEPLDREVIGTRLARGLAFVQASGHPFRLPYEPVRNAVHDMAAAPGFRENLRGLEPIRRR